MKKITSILFCLIFMKVGIAQTIPTFSKFYVQDSFYAGNYSVIRDGDSLVLLPNFFDRASFQGFFLVKTDLSGNESYRFIIKKPDTTYGGHFGVEAHRTKSGHFIFSGAIFGTFNSFSSSFLYKLNNTLDTVYIKETPNGNCSFLGSAIELSDGNYITCGYKAQCNTTSVLSSNGIIYKTDSFGNVLWQHEDIHSYFSNWDDASAFPGGFYVSVMVGTQDKNANDSVIEVRKFDNNGNQKWALVLGTPGRNNQRGVMIGTADGGGIQTLNVIDTTSFGTNNFWDPSVIFKFDSNGSMVWQKWIEGCNFTSICELNDGSIVFCVNQYGSPFGGSLHSTLAGELFKLDKDGNLLWDQRITDKIDTNYDSYLFDVTGTADGGIAATGQGLERGAYRQGAWLVKVDSNGCLNGDCPQLHTAINEIANEQDRFLVFPNPSTTQFTVAVTETDYFKQFKSLEFTLYDLTGRGVKEQSFDQQAITMRRDNLSSGLYLWQVTTDRRILSNGKVLLK